jgi:hypothetical protein
VEFGLFVIGVFGDFAELAEMLCFYQEKTGLAVFEATFVDFQSFDLVI